MKKVLTWKFPVLEKAMAFLASKAINQELRANSLPDTGKGDRLLSGTMLPSLCYLSFYITATG
jgi:hypothetical protein